MERGGEVHFFLKGECYRGCIPRYGFMCKKKINQNWINLYFWIFSWTFLGMKYSAEQIVDRETQV